MLIDGFGVTHLAYSLMEEAAHISYDDEDDTPLVYLIPKKLRSRFRTTSCQPIAMVVPKS
ncbi:hypothetical protein R3W88_024123 [Solanum pinnatisectum]|uniref:Uncharacterized protein n=1 Tax=Solanum pinnatisectum TaxID=50273 RepID=A0AAV9M2Q2_9SOLN|nr:hypothetical protein R3W88_024123 [Solanum pinnatisectum]